MTKLSVRFKTKLLIFLSILFITTVTVFTSCTNTQPSKTFQSQNENFYVKSRLHISDFSFLNIAPNYNTYKKEYNKQSDAPKAYNESYDYFLREYLSVNNNNWHQDLFYKENVFWPLDLNSVAKRNLGQEETFQVIKAIHIEFDSTIYKVLKLKHKSFSDKEKIIRMNLIFKNDRFYLIEDFDNEELKEIMDTFYRVKNEIGIELTKVDIEYDFPPSGNKVRDEILQKEIYYNFGVGYRFNINRFIHTTKQWKAEGKIGLINYFFEN